MPCFYPIDAWQGRKPNANGKYPPVFRFRDGWNDKPMKLPCGQCTGCRLEHSRQWAIRCVHEASLYDDNVFLTLTYNDMHLPPDGALKLLDFQLFMKRLRKKFEPQKIRFFHCGEYGDKTGRPHYHACLFNVDFFDKKKYKNNNGHYLYTSEILTSLWTHPQSKTVMGDALIGNVTFESAAYCARYIMKKITGELAYDHYGNLPHEYVTMSRRPGIGKPWLDLFHTDVYPDDFLIINGVKQKPPKFYDQQFEIMEPQQMALMKAKRRTPGNETLYDNNSSRLRVRETVKKAQIQALKRELK